MSWLGDMERADPAYPGHPGDITTTSWSKQDVANLEHVLETEERTELEAARRAYRGRHRRES